jgi:NAD+ synthase (glutamine-hydrolysing)
VKIAIGQINPIIGDLESNFKSIVQNIQIAREQKARLLVLPEMCLIGYPPKDLLLKHGLVELQESYIKELAAYTDADFGMLVGSISQNKGYGKKFFNSLFFLAEGEIRAVASKTLLPNYDVFDETRYFESAQESTVIEWQGIKFGVSICEDIWTEAYPSLYKRDPINDLLAKGAEILINAAASPYTYDKPQRRRQLIGNVAKRYGVPVIYVNQVGANDQLIFDGASMVFSAQGDLSLKAKIFEEQCLIFDSEDLVKNKSIEEEFYGTSIENMHKALILGLKDYVRKCGFKKIILGLSGGIDSAVVACLAAEALGAENVLAVMMPSKHTSETSLHDAQELTANLGLDKHHNYHIIPITELHAKAKELIPDMSSVAEENLQARLRANILLTLSNSYGALLLCTANKSELAVGYSTLYGDSCGGIAVIGDLLKTSVYELAKHINRDVIVIPMRIIERAPSAELRPNQKDEDTLPPYEILDKIIPLYVQEMKTQQEIIDAGFDKNTVSKVLNMIDGSEYKRQQSAPPLKIAGKAFGLGRRMPIAQGFKHK